jgi:FkbM family methyltransferase
MISFAQNGEDVVLWRLFRGLGRRGFFIDVGAGHAVLHSVTKWFSLNGWTGVNVEPVDRLYDELVSDRPDEINVKAVCGAAPGSTTLVVADELHWGLSSVDTEVAQQISAVGSVAGTVEVDVITVSSLIERYAPPTGVDFLKIDVEGAERQVIEGAALGTHYPRVLVIEALEPGSLSPNHDRWESLVLESGYIHCLFDGLNRFYCRESDEEARYVLQSPACVLDEFVTHREHVLQAALEHLASRLPSWSDALLQVADARSTG